MKTDKQKKGIRKTFLVRVSGKTHRLLEKRKVHPNQSFDEVLTVLIENEGTIDVKIRRPK